MKIDIADEAKNITYTYSDRMRLKRTEKQRKTESKIYTKALGCYKGQEETRCGNNVL